MTKTQNKNSKPILCQNFSDGEWAVASGKDFEILSPYTNQVIGTSKETSEIDLDKMVSKAVKAQKNWGDTPIKERSQVMFRFRELLLENMKTICTQISTECGKTLPEAEAEVLKGIEVIEFALSLQNLDSGGKIEVSRGVFCEYRREPLGVVAAITPFNFPAMVPLWMIPIAITLGNSFIWKPSDKTPLTSILIADLLKKAKLPDGVFNIAQGGKLTVDAILKNADIKAIGFVGSTAIAKYIYQEGSKYMKRVLALGGAKNHIILMPDADLTLTGKGIADSFTGCAGQRCMAASVLCTVASTAQEKKQIAALIEAIVDQTRKITCGDKMGAIITKTSLKNLNSAVEKAQKNGAKILLDGRAPKVESTFKNGNWIAPTILDDVKPGTAAATEELFGPVLSIVHCKSLHEALEVHKSSPYGNALSVFTQNGGVAEQVAAHATAGMIGINIGVPVPREPFSFGGTNESKFGHGDITGVHSLNFWTDIKKITTKWAEQKDASWMG